VAPAWGPTPPIRLDGSEAVDRALAERVYLRIFPPRLMVASSVLTEEATRSWQARIDRLLDECGCGLGAAVALAALGAYLASVFTNDVPAATGGIILRSLGALFLGATAGKLAGIGWARFTLRQALVSLRQDLRT
jgi:hypothetical protein